MNNAPGRALELGGRAATFRIMAMNVEQIEQEALGLPSEARARLADRLVESLGAADLNSIDELWAAEAKRRRDEVRQGRFRTIPGPEGLKRVRRALGR
jgi:hypothetical protein